MKLSKKILACVIVVAMLAGFSALAFANNGGANLYLAGSYTSAGTNTDAPAAGTNTDAPAAGTNTDAPADDVPQPEPDFDSSSLNRLLSFWKILIDYILNLFRMFKLPV